jgi:hypothetical protein
MNWISPTGLRPCAAEALLQPHGGAKYAAIDADIFAENDDVRILLHGTGERQIDGLH